MSIFHGQSYYCICTRLYWQKAMTFVQQWSFVWYPFIVRGRGWECDVVDLRLQGCFPQRVLWFTVVKNRFTVVSSAFFRFMLGAIWSKMKAEAACNKRSSRRQKTDFVKCISLDTLQTFGNDELAKRPMDLLIVTT